jgi:hypothetical protein
LETVLEAMMLVSDNLRANAVQDFFGRDAINATALAAGMHDTLLAHRFGCGGPQNDPANRSTAFDLALLFEGIASGRLLEPAGRELLESFMLRGEPPGIVDAAREAGASLGIPAEVVADFLERIKSSYKAGWWATNLSVAGMVALPDSPCADDVPRRYAFAVFTEGAERIAAGFEVTDVLGVLLEDEVRSALQAFAAADRASCVAEDGQA